MRGVVQSKHHGEGCLRHRHGAPLLARTRICQVAIAIEVYWISAGAVKRQAQRCQLHVRITIWLGNWSTGGQISIDIRIVQRYLSK
jgi:hypothetical protein